MTFFLLHLFPRYNSTMSLWPILLIVTLTSRIGIVSGVKVDLDRVLVEVSPRFLSLALDAHLVAERWRHFDFHSARVINMARALAPAHLRLGGTAADLLIFDEATSNANTSDETSCYAVTDVRGRYVCEDLNALYKRGNFTMTKADWIRLNEFCEKAKWNLLFDFNALLRDANGDWDPRNAKKLLDFTVATKFADGNLSFELGNEPNSLWHQLHFNLTAEHLGKDFVRLRNLLDEYKTTFAGSILTGPDLNAVRRCDPKGKHCPALKYLGAVLKRASHVLDAVSWHHYYLDGHTATIKDFLRVDVLNNLQDQINIVRDFVEGRLGLKPAMWLGETSSAYGGGVKGASDKYAAGFLWLDKLGVAAANGYQVVIRQTFYHGAYAMIGEDLRPNPDFWISLLYKRLVNERVLKTTSRPLKAIRLYAHCSKSHSGGVVLFGLNVGKKSAKIRLPKTMAMSKIVHYVLSPANGNLASRTILLNGKPMRLISDEDVPDLVGLESSPSSLLKIKSHEMAFWVFPQARAKACQSQSNSVQ